MESEKCWKCYCDSHTCRSISRVLSGGVLLKLQKLLYELSMFQSCLPTSIQLHMIICFFRIGQTECRLQYRFERDKYFWFYVRNKDVAVRSLIILISNGAWRQKRILHLRKQIVTDNTINEMNSDRISWKTPKTFSV